MHKEALGLGYFADVVTERLQTVNLRGGGKVRHLITLLFVAGEPQKLDGQKFISLEWSFHKLFKNTTFTHLRGIGKTLS